MTFLLGSGAGFSGDYRVRRYPKPTLAGMNLVIDDILQGGGNGALNLDGHGKTLSFLQLSILIHMPNINACDSF